MQKFFQAHLDAAIWAFTLRNVDGYQGALEMAKLVQEKPRRPEIKKLAQRIIHFIHSQ